jgi:CDP-glucose 4,6-dehydratase
MRPEFWRNKRVLVTGHTGFKGSWLCLWLNSMGAQTTGYALEPATRPSLFDAARIDQGMRSIIGDIRDLDSLKKCFEAARPEIVIHMAAQSLVLASYEDPVGTYATNVLGTVNVLEAARNQPAVRSVVVVTSDKCYENHEWVWGYRESDAMGGRDPYSNSKGCAELVTAAYRQSFFANGERGVAISSARSGNVIGGGDWSPNRLVPDVVSAFAAGTPVTIRHPTAVRPWQYVLEPLAGYLTLAERSYDDPGKFSESWNFGPPDEDARPVSWLVANLAELWGAAAGWKAAENGQAHEASFLKLDCSKARARLEWKSRLDLRSALEWSVDWYKCHYTGSDVSALSFRQIAQYQQLLHE